MRDEFEKLVFASKIQPRHVDALVALATHGYCVHRSWGFGRIKSVDTVFARFTIDFPGKPGHTMDLSFAAESLKAIPSDHILARKVADLEGLREMAALHHLDLIKVVLQSFGGRATLDQIQHALVPDVIRDDWKKWWEAAKKEMKKDGHFQVPTKKTEPVIFQAQETLLDDRMLAEFRAAKGLRARANAAGEVLKNINEIADKQRVASEIIAALNVEIAPHLRTQPATALEGIFARDDLRAAVGLPPIEGELGAKEVWGQDLRLGAVLDELPAAKHRRALQTFKDSSPIWMEAVRTTINSVPAKVAGECAHLLISDNRLEQLKETLARLINQHQASSELLLWLAKERSDSFADILGPEVFRAMLTAMERDQFNERKSNRLRDYILDDPELLVELIGSADLEVIKDLTRALQLSPVFDDMDKRSLLARIVKTYPTIQAVISGETTRQDNSLLVSWPSLERRKLEYEELVQKKIPANSKEIAIARSYGDLRENHEYKAAKEMQKVLMRRKGELESQLVRARGSDFANPRTDIVGLGTRVTLTDLSDNHVEQLSILGAWDGNPDQGIISYLTPMAQSLIGKKPGEEAAFESEGERRQLRVDAIEVCPGVPGGPPAA